MIKKFSKLLIVTIIALFVWTSSTNAIRLNMDDITHEVLETNPDVNYIYIVGKHIFTDKAMPLSIADFMLAARTIDVSEDAGSVKTDPIYGQMSSLQYLPVYNDEYTEIIGFKYGQKDLTGNGTPKEEYDIEYIDYNKLENKNRVIFSIDGKTILDRVATGEKVSAPKVPDKEGYTFLGWYISGTDSLFNFDTVITKDINLEARFEISKYKVVLKLDDDTIYGSYDIEHGSKITEPTLDPKEDYEFLGWYVGDTKYNFESLVKSDIELVGRYRQLDKPSITTTIKDAIKDETQEFEIVIKANDYKDRNVKQVITFNDKNAIGKIEYYNGKEWVELTFKDNYVTVPEDSFELKDMTSKFRITWNSMGENRVSISLIDKDTAKVYSEVSKDIVIAGKKLTVTYNNDGQVTTGEVVEGGKVNPPTPKAKTGYDFIGWYIGEDKFDLETPVTENITLIAKYELKTYVVKYMVDDITFKEVEVKHGSATTKIDDIPEKEGYTFKEWQLNSKAYDFTKKVTSDLELKASFNINKYTVTFMNDTTKFSSATVNYGEKVSIPTTKPTKTGHTFVNWLLDGNEYNFDTPVTGNLELKANYTPNKYTVTFMSDGQEVTKQTVEYNNTATSVTAPEKEGYTFIRWEKGTSAFDFTTPITSNITLTAKYEIKKYTVTFKDGDTIVTTKTVNHGTKVSAPTNPSKTGYTFVDWRLNGTTYNFDNLVTDNIELQANYQVKTYKVTFKVDNTTYLESDVEYGKLVSKPNDPVKEGYTFNRWYNGKNAYDFNAPITGDITLTANFDTKTYIVVFDSDGGSAVALQTIEYNKQAVKPANPTKEGYTFKEWQLDGKTYDFKTAVTADITLKAIYDINKYTVKFMVDGTPYDTKEVEYSNVVSKPTDPTKEGYRFDGWYIATEAFNFNTKVVKNLELTAKFTKLHTVTFNTDGGNNIDSQIVANNETATAPANPTKTGYTFKEWQLNGKTFNFTTKITANVTLKAVWTINTYTVTFDSDGGSAVAAQTINYNATATSKTPTKTGYTFKEWQLNGKTYDFKTPVTSNITLKAVWTINEYTVTFKNGDTEIETKKVNHGNKVTAPEKNPTKTGYTFKEWQLNGTKFDFATKITGNITLKAAWTINSYTVTFKNGEDVVETKKVNYNSTTTAPTSPTKTGYNFNGWYNGDTKFETTTKITGNVTYTAEFSKKTYTITFNSDGGSSVDSQTVKYNESLSSLPTPTKAGYKFLGWYDGSTKVTKDTKFTSNKTLKAKWEKNTTSNDPVTDINQMVGTYISENYNGTYQLTIEYNSPRFYIELVNLRYGQIATTGNLSIGGNEASTDGLTIYFYNGYVIYENGNSLLNGKYIKK